MKYKDIVYNIKDKNFEKIYLLYGKEHYLIDNAIKLFRESLKESMIDFNLEIIDGKETTLDQLLSSIVNSIFAYCVYYAFSFIYFSIYSKN